MKTHNFRSILFGHLFLCSTVVTAQTYPQLANFNYVPPSASATSLGKFGDIPVGLYTGVPNISIPIYSYKGIDNGLSLDVSLDYHAGGIRVEEIGGNVGMGWALNAGGVITRTMRGEPDDFPQYGYIALSPMQPPPDTAINAANLFNQNAYDSEQDEFDFDFNGHSGKFVLDASGNPQLISQSNIRIQHIVNPVSGTVPYAGFIATDENGIKYIFTDAETTSVEVTPYYNTTYSSSWYLTSMVNPSNGDTIKFTYTTAGEYYQTFATDTKMNQYSGNGLSIMTTAIINNTGGVTGGSGYDVLSKKIKQISFPNRVALNFYYIHGTRCDLIGDSVLDQIQQIDGLTGATKSMNLHQTYIDQYGHYYGFFPAPCDTVNNTTGSTNLRLRLDSVQEYSGLVSKPPYVFTYNDTFLLPPRNSREQDFWGYYNGTRNTTGNLVPFYLYYDPSIQQSYFLDGADRRSDSNAVKACSLIQITYPTGGTTKFNYEVNRAGDNNLIISVPTYQSAGVGSTFAEGDSTSGSTQFTINRSPANTAISFAFSMGGWCPGLPTVATIVFSITSLNGQTTYATESFGYSDVGTTKNYAVLIPNGTYLLTWQINSPPSISNVCDEAFGFSLNWQYSNADSTQLAGGLRIASTVDYDGVSHNNDVTKTYTYLDSTGKSSGYTGNVFTYGYKFQNCSNNYVEVGDLGTIDFITQNNYFVRTANSNIPLAYTQGSSVGYSTVTMATTGPSNIGKEVDYFYTYKDFAVIKGASGGINWAVPCSAPPQTEDWGLGLPTMQEIYDGNGHLVQKTTNTYGYTKSEIDNLYNFKMAVVEDPDCFESELGEQTYGPEYAFASYYWWTGFAQKLQTSTVDYSTSGDSIVNTVQYQYDPVYIDECIMETRTDSKGDTVNTYHYYPFDYTISGSVFGAMTDSNMIATPVSNEKWKKLNGAYYLTAADATNYSQFAGGLLPSAHYKLFSSQPVAQGTIGAFNPNALLRNTSLYYQDLSYDSYDAKSNPAQLTARGKVTNFIWDVNRQYPIARVLNGDTAHVAYTSFEADGTGGWTISGGSLDMTKGLTGRYSYVPSGAISKSGLTTAATYVVSYWTTGSPLTISGTISGYPLKGKTVTVGSTMWTYYEHMVTGVSSISLTGSSNIDELRFYPSTAQMKTYTYIPLAGVSSECDEDNRVTFYEYDPLQRLTDIRDQDWNVVKTFQYHFHGQ